MISTKFFLLLITSQCQYFPFSFNCTHFQKCCLFLQIDSKYYFPQLIKNNRPLKVLLPFPFHFYSDPQKLHFVNYSTRFRATRISNGNHKGKLNKEFKIYYQFDKYYELSVKYGTIQYINCRRVLEKRLKKFCHTFSTLIFFQIY